MARINDDMLKADLLAAATELEADFDAQAKELAKVRGENEELDRYTNELSNNLDTARAELTALREKVEDITLTTEGPNAETTTLTGFDAVYAMEQVLEQFEADTPEAEVVHTNLSPELQAVVRTVRDYATKRNVNLLRSAESNLRRAIVAAQ